ncbi:TolB family protein [Thermoproteota archaeon]
MDSWNRFVDWCQRPSKIKIRTFNPTNIIFIAYSILLISLITSGTWFYQVLSITQTTPISASISGDGAKIAYTSDVDGDDEVFVVNSDGTGLTQLTHNTAIDRCASISGDETKIAFHSNVDGDWEVFVVNSDGTGLTQLTHNTATDRYASISSDGTKIAYTSDVDGDYEMFVIINDIPMPLPMPKDGFSFPVEYAIVGIGVVIIAVVLVVIFFVKKK